jgi:hypothetical protein
MLATTQFRIFCSCLYLKNVSFKIYKLLFCLLFLYGCEIWSLMLREEHRLRVSDNRVLRRIFWPRRDEVTGGWRNCAVRASKCCSLHQILGWSCQGGWDRKGIRMQGRDEKCMQYFGWKSWREEPLKRPKHRWDDNLKWILRTEGLRVRSRLIWLRTHICGEILWTWSWTFSFHKKQAISWLGEWI